MLFSLNLSIQTPSELIFFFSLYIYLSSDIRHFFYQTCLFLLPEIKSRIDSKILFSLYVIEPKFLAIFDAVRDLLDLLVYTL